jgi:hypothetical protein
VIEDESPYPEVRCAVANTDDPTMPSSTFRAWVVGLILAVLIPGINQFLFFRYPSIAITQVCGFFCPVAFMSLLGGPLLSRIFREKTVPMMLGFPICKAWARYLPNISLFGIPLNPGPFTIKEHVITTVMAVVGAKNAYAVSVTPTWQYKIMSALFHSVRILTISLRLALSQFRKSFMISTSHLPVSFRSFPGQPFGQLIGFYGL